MSFDFLFGLMFLAKYSRPFTSLPPTKVFSSHLDIELAIMFTQDQKASSRICISATMAYSSSSVTWVAVTMPPVRKSRMYVSRLKSYHLLNSCSHLFWPFLFVLRRNIKNSIRFSPGVIGANRFIMTTDTPANKYALSITSSLRLIAVYWHVRDHFFAVTHAIFNNYAGH